MKFGLSILKALCLLLIAAPLIAQEKANVAPVVVLPGKNTAPIFWEYYQLPSEKVSVMLPKLPNQLSLDEPCGQIHGGIYQVYADNAVYEFRFYAKSRDSLPPSCSGKVLFSKINLEERLRFLRHTNPAPVWEANAEVGVRKAIQFRWETKNEIAMRWIFEDFANDRWLELSINRRKDAVVDDVRFLNSLKFSEAIGKGLRAGSSITLGDNEQRPQSVPIVATTEEPLDIVNRFHATYPAAARESNTQGTVKLRVEFLANGAIGKVTVLSGLPNGLTEAAITAAQRLAFLPKRVNGVAVSIAREVDYDFHII